MKEATVEKIVEGLFIYILIVVLGMSAIVLTAVPVAAVIALLRWWA